MSAPRSLVEAELVVAVPVAWAGKGLGARRTSAAGRRANRRAVIVLITQGY